MDALNGSGPNATSASGESDAEEIASALYALRPDGFAAARDEAIRRARADGHQALARELAGLRRPTQSAWLVNLLWRHQRDTMEELLRLGDELRRALDDASVTQVHSVTSRRRELEATLIHRAHTIAGEAGVNVTASMEREVLETLAAALARTDVADEVRTGRMVKPASYAAFPDVETSVTQASRADAQTPGRKAPPPSRRQREDPDPAQRANERRGEAERRLQDARAALEAASSALAEHRRAAEAAHEHQEKAREDLEALQRQLAKLREEVASAGRTAIAAARRRDEAEKAHETARRTLERAEQGLKEATSSS